MRISNLQSVEMCHFFNMLFASRQKHMCGIINNAAKLNVHIKKLMEEKDALTKQLALDEDNTHLRARMNACLEKLTMLTNYRQHAKDLKKRLKQMNKFAPFMQRSIKEADNAYKAKRVSRLQRAKDAVSIRFLKANNYDGANKYRYLISIYKQYEQIEVALRKAKQK